MYTPAAKHEFCSGHVRKPRFLSARFLIARILMQVSSGHVRKPRFLSARFLIARILMQVSSLCRIVWIGSWQIRSGFRW